MLRWWRIECRRSGIPGTGLRGAFYGRQVPASDVPKINAPLLLHYAQLDTRINEGWPAYEAALKANKKVYEAYIYPGVNHGFHNDSTPVMIKLQLI